MTGDVTADWTTLVNQAPMTIDTFMAHAPDDWSIDQKLKYAELCAHDFRSTSIVVSSQKIRDAIETVASGLEGLEARLGELGDVQYLVGKQKSEVKSPPWD